LREINKARGNIGTLPYLLRLEINERLLNNKMTYVQIAEWLLGVTIPDEGVPVSTLYDGAKDPVSCCKNALARWFSGKQYKRWLTERSFHDDAKRRFDNLLTRFEAVGEPAADQFAKSMVLQGMEDTAQGTAKPMDIFLLAQAWAKIRGLKKEDAHTEEIVAKLQKLASETKAVREKGKELDESERGAILDKVDEILLGGAKNPPLNPLQGGEQT
jgi:hypothetical protein